MKTTRYDVYIGLHQKCNNQHLDSDFLKQIMNDAFSEYKIDFSINKQLGGYIHEDGTYIIENSFRMTFVGDRTLQEEKEFYKALKDYFKQESVLVIKTKVDSSYM